MTSEPRRLKLALIGLGRLGAIRARILAFQQPHIEFVAACDTKPGADKWAAANLPASVKFFADPEECMRNSGAEAVLISTATATHAPLICLALDLDLVSKILPASFSETPAQEQMEKLTALPACHVREAHLGRCHHDSGGRRKGGFQASFEIPGALLSTL
jgi:myo-inositol 2-dehydrogenase/D-chiro-inositol 1-dehydrogenase